VIGIAIEPMKKLVGVKCVTVNENFFNGHFPGHPVMPGLILEALAQAGGLLVKFSLTEDTTNKVTYLMAIDNARFRKPVVPGDRTEPGTSRFAKQKGATWKTNGRPSAGAPRPTTWRRPPTGTRASSHGHPPDAPSLSAGDLTHLDPAEDLDLQRGRHRSQVSRMGPGNVVGPHVASSRETPSSAPATCISRPRRWSGASPVYLKYRGGAHPPPGRATANVDPRQLRLGPRRHRRRRRGHPARQPVPRHGVGPRGPRLHPRQPGHRGHLLRAGRRA